MKAGEIAHVSGPSGSGKSSFFDCMAGFLKQESGQLWWENSEFHRELPRLRPIAYMPQYDALFAKLSVRKNLELAGDVEDFQELMSVFELHSDLLKKKPQDVSGGELSRCNLLRALLRACSGSKPIILLDEPFANIQGSLSAKIALWLRTFCQDKALLIADHGGTVLGMKPDLTIEVQIQ